ncbi:TetR/AcrR family transcriptional regulator [Mycolicibacterium stellerae]|uniref:TetR/AcrR family transcriptional regulator n=1 Tax=Mycolicibacterium stellerae TaxID=2358193 RepID=UPI0013DE10F6|nr:TetR/AcrR family transcriptional regulator [Mycolicibacterium stellerae]
MDDQARQHAVDVALALLADQGFDATSMAQIAEATGIPADDVVRTLGTKEAIILKVAEDMLGSVVKALADIDPQTPLVEALMSAHSTVLADIIADTGPVKLDRMRRMGKAITSSTDLQKKVAAQRVEMLTGVLADRFGAPATDKRVQSGLRLWSAVLAATYLDVLDRHGRFDPLVDVESPEYMRGRLNRAFRIVTGRGTRLT